MGTKDRYFIKNKGKLKIIIDIINYESKTSLDYCYLSCTS